MTSSRMLLIAAVLISRDGDGDGLVVYQLKRAFCDGTTEFLFEPLEILARLAALVPKQRSHLVQYHAVLSLNARHRRLVVPERPPTLPYQDEEPARLRGRAPMTWMRRLWCLFNPGSGHS